MLAAIRAVGRGEAIFGPAVATRLLDYFGASRPSAFRDVFPTLTEREREILRLIARGKSNGEIARDLSFSNDSRGDTWTEKSSS